MLWTSREKSRCNPATEILRRTAGQGQTSAVPTRGTTMRDSVPVRTACLAAAPAMVADRAMDDLEILLTGDRDQVGRVRMPGDQMDRDQMDWVRTAADKTGQDRMDRAGEARGQTGRGLVDPGLDSIPVDRNSVRAMATGPGSFVPIKGRMKSFACSEICVKKLPS
jgi:hypothetical protein